MKVSELKLRLQNIIKHTEDADVLKVVFAILAGSQSNDSQLKKNDFRSFLLSWPEMSENEFKEIKERSKRLNEWR